MKKHRVVLDSHIHERDLENARFLLAAGEHVDHVARRLGFSTETLMKKLERGGKSGESHPDEVTTGSAGAGQGPLRQVQRPRE